MNNAVDWVPETCGQSVVDFGKLEGYTLPADSGKISSEPVIDNTGKTVGDANGSSVAFATLAASLDQSYRDYYIAMRWNYATWNWDGTHNIIDQKQADWMQQSARKILATNPKTGKSVIVIALEAGPAPWMGVDDQPNNIPKEGWINPQQGTPIAYTGDVAGLSAAALTELGGVEPGAPTSGDSINFSWAPDQSSKPGPITIDQANQQTQSCTQATGPGNVVFISQRDQRWNGQTICWGSAPDNCSSVYSEGCWATSVAMIISTLGNRGFVTPMQTEGNGQPPASFGNSGLTEQWYDTINTATLNAALDAVRNGGLVLVHGSGGGPDGGPFYNTPSHWEVIRGITADGNVLVDDPWDLPDPKNPSQPAPGGHTLTEWPLYRDVVPYTLGIGVITRKQA